MASRPATAHMVKIIRKTPSPRSRSITSGRKVALPTTS
jgi:hypothetical protein